MTHPNLDPNSPESRAAQAKRNKWLGLALFGFVILVGLVSATRVAQAGMGPDSSFYYRLDE